MWREVVGSQATTQRFEYNVCERRFQEGWYYLYTRAACNQSPYLQATSQLPVVGMIQSLSSGMSRVSRRCSIRSFRLGVLDVPFGRWQRLASGSVDKKVIVQDVNTGALLVSHWVLRGIQRAWTIAWYCRMIWCTAFRALPRIQYYAVMSCSWS
jgi:hypothetical protein